MEVTWATLALALAAAPRSLWAVEPTQPPAYRNLRFIARYETCADEARFIQVLADDGDCQVLCGPSGDPKLLRLKDKSVCMTSDTNEPGVCSNGVCKASPIWTEREQVRPTHRPTRPPRTTTKFVRSTLPPITSGFTYSWQKWATYKPSAAPGAVLKGESNDQNRNSTAASTAAPEAVSRLGAGAGLNSTVADNAPGAARRGLAASSSAKRHHKEPTTTTSSSLLRSTATNRRPFDP